MDTVKVPRVYFYYSGFRLMEPWVKRVSRVIGPLCQKQKKDMYYVYITIPLYWVNYSVKRASSGVQVCPLKFFLLIKNHLSHWCKHVLYNYMYTWLVQFCMQLYTVKCQQAETGYCWKGCYPWQDTFLAHCHQCTVIEVSLKVSILDAIRLLAKSWRQVESKMMFNCFQKGGFMKPLPKGHSGSQDPGVDGNERDDTLSLPEVINGAEHLNIDDAAQCYHKTTTLKTTL